MIAFAIALIINYPNLAEQRRRVAQHAGNVLSVVSLIFAAGIFTGILSGTGMVEAMSRSLLAVSYTHLDVYKRQVLAWPVAPLLYQRIRAMTCSERRPRPTLPPVATLRSPPWKTTEVPEPTAHAGYSGSARLYFASRHAHPDRTLSLIHISWAGLRARQAIQAR